MKLIVRFDSSKVTTHSFYIWNAHIIHCVLSKCEGIVTNALILTEIVKKDNISERLTTRANRSINEIISSKSRNSLAKNLKKKIINSYEFKLYPKELLCLWIRKSFLEMCRLNSRINIAASINLSHQHSLILF